MGELGTAAAKAGPAVARGLISAAWRRWRPDTSHAALDLHADNLADRVRRAETPRLEQLGVTRGQGVDVYYEALARVRGAGGEDLGTLQEVWAYYSALRPGRLVVLGEPGSGKTVLALHLLLDLLDYRRHPAAPQPIPVRVNAASWNVETYLSTWLTESLATDYGLLPPVARKLVEDGRVLPVLDGLDEMDPLGASPERARVAVEQLNQPPWRGRPVILTCRAAVYDSVRELRRPGGAAAGLHIATAVTVSKLSPPEICRALATYLEADGLDPNDWAPLTRSLTDAPDGVLADALSTPWMLTLAVSRPRAAGATAASELASCPDTAAVRDKLFAA